MIRTGTGTPVGTSEHLDRSRDFVVIASTIVMICSLVYLGVKNTEKLVRNADQERTSIEHTASVQPPLRIVPLEEGHTLNCFTFPMRAYDNTLLKCVACREDSLEFGPVKDLRVDCR